QVAADIKLDVVGEPIRELALDVDAPLSLVSARIADTQLTWSEEATAAGADVGAAISAQHPSSRRVTLRFPEPLHGAGRVVRLAGVAPLPERSRLPLVRPAGNNEVWQEGSATLICAEPLEIEDLQTSGCRQTKAEPAPGPARGEVLTLQF